MYTQFSCISQCDSLKLRTILHKMMHFISLSHFLVVSCYSVSFQLLKTTVSGDCSVTETEMKNYVCHNISLEHSSMTWLMGCWLGCLWLLKQFIDLFLIPYKCLSHLPHQLRCDAVQLHVGSSRDFDILAHWMCHCVYLPLFAQTAENVTGLFTHPHYFVLSQSIAHPHGASEWL